MINGVWELTLVSLQKFMFFMGEWETKNMNQLRRKFSIKSKALTFVDVMLL
jgi:hypothetical protein